MKGNYSTFYFTFSRKQKCPKMQWDCIISVLLPFILSLAGLVQIMEQLNTSEIVHCFQRFFTMTGQQIQSHSINHPQTIDKSQSVGSFFATRKKLNLRQGCCSAQLKHQIQMIIVCFEIIFWIFLNLNNLLTWKK